MEAEDKSAPINISLVQQQHLEGQLNLVGCQEASGPKSSGNMKTEEAQTDIYKEDGSGFLLQLFIGTRH